MNQNPTLSPEDNPSAQRPPAFPSKFRIVKPNQITGKSVVFDVLNTGLTKREFFASMALQGYLANSQEGQWCESIAKMAVDQADLLIKQLEQTEEKEEN